jgi:hypothetical protein
VILRDEVSFELSFEISLANRTLLEAETIDRKTPPPFHIEQSQPYIEGMFVEKVAKIYPRTHSLSDQIVSVGWAA